MNGTETSTVRRIGLRLILPVLLILAWWASSRDSVSPFWPALTDIVAAFRETWMFARVGSDVVPSLLRLLAGLVIAVAVGVAVGALLGRSRILGRAMNPIVEFCRAVPGTALVPVAVVLLEIGDGSKIAVIAFVCTFPVLLNTIDAVRGIDPQLEDVARSYRLTRTQRVSRLLLPAAAPQIVAGIRTALAIAFIMMVITELYAATDGIGFVTLTARNAFDVPQMWAGTVLMGLLGAGLTGVFVLIERRALRWRYQMTGRN